MKPICLNCGGDFAIGRYKIGYTSCLDCGDKKAKQVKHCVAPINKSNYYFISDPEMLKQLNPKRT